MSKRIIRARPFDFPYDGKLEPAKTALLVIDLQIGFLSADGYFARKGYDPAPLRTIVPTAAKLVRAARDAGCLVIWTRQGYRADLADATPYDRWRMARAGTANGQSQGEPPRRGHPEFDIVPELEVGEHDVIIDKTANSAFCQTDLESVLCAHGITHLLFSGCTTDVCVHSTLREAADRKYQCLLIEDACASADGYAHEAAIHMVTVEDGVFGVVAGSADTLAALRA